MRRLRGRADCERMTDEQFAGTLLAALRERTDRDRTLSGNYHTSPPERRDAQFHMTVEDRIELGAALH